MKKGTLTVQVNRNNVRVASFRTGDAEFVEAEHKRDAKGEFAVMAGGSGGSAEEPEEDVVEIEDTLNRLREDRPHPTREERTAIGNYKTYEKRAYRVINNCLRSQENCQNPDAQQIKGWLERSRTKEAVTVYRSVKGEYAKALAANSAAGTEFTDRGIISTTMVRSFAKGWAGKKGIVLAINVPVGSKAAPIVDDYDDESEVVIQVGSTMRVQSYNPKTRVLHVDLIQNHQDSDG